MVIKYLICYLIEKQHRLVFDTWYVQDVKIGFRGEVDIVILDLMQKLFPDYRRFLKQWSKVNRYERYTAYWDNVKIN